jgi:hypothetical protein
METNWKGEKYQMPKLIDYPRASFKNCLELANAVDELGGDCTADTCAEKLNKKVSGGFWAIVQSTTKFGLIANTKGKLQTTDLFRSQKLAYDEEEKRAVLRKAFFNAPLFENIFEKYKTVKLPFNMLGKILIREFQVDDALAQRVAGYFLEGAKELGILNEDYSFNIGEPQKTQKEPSSGMESIEAFEKPTNTIGKENVIVKVDEDIYVAKLSGPDMNTTIKLSGKDDFHILEVMLKKIKNKLGILDEK